MGKGGGLFTVCRAANHIDPIDPGPHAAQLDAFLGSWDRGRSGRIDLLTVWGRYAWCIPPAA